MHRPSRPTSAPSTRPSPAGRRPSVRGRPVLAAAAIAIVAVVGTSCGGDPTISAPTSTTATSSVPRTEPPSTPTSTTTTTTTAANDDEAEVRAVIDRYWDAYLEAVSIPDPEHAGLNAILHGEALLRITSGIDKLKSDGLRVVTPPASLFAHNIVTIQLEDSTAVVEECVIDDLQKVDVATGAVVDGDVVTAMYLRHLTKTDVGWRVMASEQSRVEDGVKPCSDFA